MGAESTKTAIFSRRCFLIAATADPSSFLSSQKRDTALIEKSKNVFFINNSSYLK